MDERAAITIFFDQLRYLSLSSIFFRFWLALFCGSVIGYERGKRKQAAGLRTHILVCMGAASVMMINQYTIQYFSADADPVRMGAQVISGIGFLGAGTIMVTGSQWDQRIKGLTTAAGLWASACMGLAIGIGFYEAALIMCIFLFLVIVTLNQLDIYFLKTNSNLRLYMEYRSDTPFHPILKTFQTADWQVVNLEYLSQGTDSNSTKVFVHLQHCTNEKENQAQTLERLGAIEGVICVEPM